MSEVFAGLPNRKPGCEWRRDRTIEHDFCWVGQAGLVVDRIGAGNVGSGRCGAPEKSGSRRLQPDILTGNGHGRADRQFRHERRGRLQALAAVARGQSQAVP